jgi:hypothetical protein
LGHKPQESCGQALFKILENISLPVDLKNKLRVRILKYHGYFINI